MEKFEILDTDGNIISVECPVGVAKRVENDTDMIEEIVNYANGGKMTGSEESPDPEAKAGSQDGDAQMDIDEGDENDTSANERAFWTPAATRHFIRLMQQYVRKVGRTPALKSKRQLWQFISEKLDERGYKFSSQSIENKWKGLERQYRRYTENPERNVYNQVVFPYKKEIEEIRKIRDSFIREIVEGKQSIDKIDAKDDDDTSDEEIREKIAMRRKSEVPNGCMRIERLVWTHHPTELLINCMKKYLNKVGKTGAIKTKKQMWKLIHEDLKEKGFVFTPDNIENKWKSLDRQYRKIAENRRSGIPTRASFAYEKEFNEVYEKKESTFPECLISSVGDQIYASYLDESQFDDSLMSPKTPKPSKTPKTPKTMDETTQNNDMNFAMRRLTAYEKRTAAIERRNNLIEKLLQKLC